MISPVSPVEVQKSMEVKWESGIIVWCCANVLRSDWRLVHQSLCIICLREDLLSMWWHSLVWQFMSSGCIVT